MKRQIAFMSLLAACGLSLLAAAPEAKWVCIQEVEMSEAHLRGEMMDNTNSAMLKVKLLDRVASAEASEPVKFTAVTTEAGTLADVIGDQLMEIDEIAVSGPINDADFATLWQASFEGKLKVLDLTASTVVGGKVPNGAFYHHDAQYNPVSHAYKLIALEKLYLPDNVTEIGSSMAGHCAHLTDIKLPASLEKIGSLAFGWCTALKSDLVFPESLKEISNNAFFRTTSLSEVVFPASLQIIKFEAFNYSGLSKATFNGPVEYIGHNAFTDCHLRELVLPDGCGFENFAGAQFSHNRELTKVVLPADLKEIPYLMFYMCTALADVTWPEALEVIGELSFSDAAISELDLPEGVTTIESQAFDGCENLASVTVPSTLAKVGDYAFDGCTSLKTIKSHIENPAPENSMYSSSYKDAVVYIPTGTKQLYTETDGWKQFVNFVEVTDGMLSYESFKANIKPDNYILSSVSFTFPCDVEVVNGGVVQLWDNDLLTIVLQQEVRVDSRNPSVISAPFGVFLDPDKHYSVVLPEGTVTDAVGGEAVNSRIVVPLDVASSGIESIEADDSAKVTAAGGFVTVEGARENADVMVVATDGKVVAHVKANGGSASIHTGSGFYIVVVDNHASRVVVK